MSQPSAVSAEPAPERPAHPRTIAALWRNAVASGHRVPAYLTERDGRWHDVSWPEAARHVDDYANGLLALGIRKGDPFAIVARTTLEWALFDFALALTGGVTAPVYPTSSEHDCGYVLDHSEAVGVLAEDEAQLSKVRAVQPELPKLDHVLSFADLDALAARGRAFATENPNALADATAAIDEDDIYTYIYTSGTTGPPKGCMIRHRNYYAMAAIIDRLEDFIVAGDTMLLYLPLAHNFGRLMHLAGPYAGYTVAFCPDPHRVPDALERVRPTVFPSVPRLYEKMHSAVVSALEDADGAKGRLAEWALDVGRRVAPLRKDGLRLPPKLALQHRLADRLVFAKVRRRLGGRLRLALSGGAPLAPEIAEFFYALGVLVLEGYGLTECTTAATVNRTRHFKFGTVGPALPGIELGLAEDGELLIRSETVFAGYLKDPVATAEVLRGDGWLASGDVAEIDDEGFVRITDRKKDILVTAGGENVAPQNLENELKTSRYISQALVVGDRRPYVVALIALDEDELAKWRAGGAENPDALVREIVDGVNARHARFAQIKRFAILPRDFSAEAGEVTPTLKLRRRVCEEHFAAVIEKLYEG